MWQWVKDNQILSGVAATMLTGTITFAKWAYNKYFRRLNVSVQPRLHDLKAETRILFIDDNEFKVPAILRKAGFTNTKRVRDVSSLDDFDVMNTDVFFVDIRGVGRQMQFTDEGLGLCSALKQRYPTKLVVIYSAEAHHLNTKLNEADAVLPKNADPYEFQQLVEQHLTQKT